MAFHDKASALRLRRAGALVLVFTLLTTACGARVGSTLRDRAAAAQLGEYSGGGSGTGVANGSTSGSGSGSALAGGNATQPGTGSGSGAATGSGTGSGTGTGSATGTGSNPGTGAGGSQGPGGSPVATTPAGGNGGATDVGVTPTTITIGNVSDLSGPVPGLFQGAETGTLAYVNYINSRGGIFGRTLVVKSADSQTSCSQTESSYSSLAPSVFAFVGSFGLYDNCGAQTLQNDPKIPLVQYMLSAQGLALPNDFSVDPLINGYATGMFAYYKQKFGTAAVQNVGTIYSDIPSAVAQADSINAAAESQGWKFTYQRAVGATETNFTADIVRMQSQNVKLVYCVGATAQIAATLVDEAEQQNWHPIFVLPVAYAGNFIQLVGGASAANGIYGAQLYSLFAGAGDAAAIPEVALFQQWMQRTNASQPDDLYAMYAWAESALFVKALQAAGPDLTQAKVLAYLKTVHSFDDNGITGPADPAGKVATHCYVLWEIQNGQFQRVDTPAAGYRCDGEFFKAS